MLPEHFAHKEFARQKLKDTIAIIRNSNIPDVIAVVDVAMEKIDAGEVKIDFESPSSGIKLATQFRFNISNMHTQDGAPIPRSAWKITPTLVLDPDALLSPQATDQHIADDFVRTASVIAQYPDGLEQPLVSVYDKALTIQEDWLMQTQASDVVMKTVEGNSVIADPRRGERRDITDILIGSGTALCDFSYTDWQTAAEALRSEYAFRNFEEFQNNRELFFITRQDLASDLLAYQFSSPIGFFTDIPDERKSYVAARTCIDFLLKREKLESTQN